MTTTNVTLDELRDALFSAQRALERHAGEVKKVVDTLNDKNPEDEWLELSQEALHKAELFLGQQLEVISRQKERLDGYIHGVRELAESEALKDLSLAGDKEEPKEDARFIHPELHRFKLEKQARIVGKYGGSPALGGGLVLQRLARDAALKATASPAAREIQYSKVEGKDAQYLAQVMKFKTVAHEDKPSEWQEEAAAKKGKEFLEQAKEPKMVKQVPATPVAAELAAKLTARQASVEAAEQEAAEAVARAARTPSSGGTPHGELADKLARRQAAAATAAAAAAEAEAEAVVPSTPPTWSTAAPFGAELASAMLARRQAAAAEAEVAEGGASTSAGTTSQQTPSPAFAFPQLQPVGAATPNTTTHAAGTRRTRSPPGGQQQAGEPVMSELQARFARMAARDNEPHDGSSA